MPKLGTMGEAPQGRRLWLRWVVMGIVATIVLSQIEGRTRKPPPY